MSEHPPDEFVRALLARDDGVSEERYAEYRRNLDREIDRWGTRASGSGGFVAGRVAAARRLLSPRLLRRLAWGAAAAAVLALLLWRPWRTRPAPEPGGAP